MSFKRWLYKDGRPNVIAKVLNKGWAMVHALGLFPNYLVTLEVSGRQSGKVIRFPLAMTVIGKERYLVSMLGEEANWVKNIRAAEGKAHLVHGTHEDVILTEVEISQRAAIIKSFLRIAPGARPHIPVDKEAPVSEFESIAAQYPVFRISKQ